MNDEMTVGIYVPSYRRANRIRTYHIFEKCTYMVRESEKDAYIAGGIAPEDIWAVEDENINDGVKAYFWIVDHAPEDIIVVADDDIGDVGFIINELYYLGGDKQRITDEIYRIAQLVYDLDIGLASNAHAGPAYNYDKEFGWKGVPSAIKWFNRRVFKARPDGRCAENFDIDIVMQELLINRICLFPKYFRVLAAADKNAGGNSGRVRQDQIDSVENMKRKWGRYFSYDFKSNKPAINVRR